jgi:hypothetical protein
MSLESGRKGIDLVKKSDTLQKGGKRPKVLPYKTK